MNKNWQKIIDDFKQISKLVNLEKKINKKKELEKDVLRADFWHNPDLAKRINQELEEINRLINHFSLLDKKIKDTKDLEKIAKAEDNFEVLKDIEKLKDEIVASLKDLEIETLFSDKYDSYEAILSIHAGTGGVDAQDWTQILSRMYIRFFEKMNWTVKIIDQNFGQEAGLKSIVFKIKGYRPYGWLKSEHGVHRLGRISPFDGEGLRQTSFALVEVLPDFGETVNLKINDSDLKIDVFKSSGPGGQSVNTTDSAVRITHLPTNLIVTCQSERSQHQNKENALSILKVKLYQLEEQKKQAKKSDIKGEILKAEWGNQIRSYILYGNQIVKDHRTQLEKKDPQKVLAGDLKDFALAYLRFKIMK